MTGEDPEIHRSLLSQLHSQLSPQELSVESPDRAQPLTARLCWSSYRISLILGINVADSCEKHMYYRTVNKCNLSKRSIASSWNKTNLLSPSVASSSSSHQQLWPACSLRLPCVSYFVLVFTKWSDLDTWIIFTPSTISFANASTRSHGQRAFGMKNIPYFAHPTTTISPLP